MFYLTSCASFLGFLFTADRNTVIVTVLFATMLAAIRIGTDEIPAIQWVFDAGEIMMVLGSYMSVIMEESFVGSEMMFAVAFAFALSKLFVYAAVGIFLLWNS